MFLLSETTIEYATWRRNGDVPLSSDIVAVVQNSLSNVCVNMQQDMVTGVQHTGSKCIDELK